MRPELVLVLVGCIVQIQAGVYIDRFLQQYNKIKDTNNGYFSPEGVPYHAVETLIVEAPDHGHETTSEAFSYYIWLEAVHGAVSGDFSTFNTAWKTMEDYIIPKIQTTNSYNSWSPASYMAELDLPSDYPSPIEFGVPAGQDPLHDELQSAYNTQEFYTMHWLLDVDNIYGFGNSQGNCESGPSAKGPSFINTFQRGPMESVWRTIPQTTCDSFKYGGQHGFLDLFVGDNNYAQQWKYTAAPDADARAVQAAYWAEQWATAAGQLSTIQDNLANAGKLGDYLRYALFDKYFKKIGNCVGPYDCQKGSGKESCHYLISWYFAWGGAMDGSWSWRIGDGTAHFGYQNPLAAWVLSNDDIIKPKGSSAVEDWTNSLDRQLEFYEWLQTSEGAFAGGATNSWQGRYGTPPDNVTQNTFHGMFYEWEPVYHDPPSNRWYGMQAWSTDRLAQLYYVTGNDRAKALLDKWVGWATSHITFDANGGYQVPDWLDWTGVPPNVHVTITKYSYDVGTASATARALTYYAAKSGNTTVKDIAKKLLDGIWQYQTALGVSTEEIMDTYNQFNEPVYVPPGWTGSYPYGDVIDSSATFLGIRSWYKDDPQFAKVQAFLDGGAPPAFLYHRFWSQSEVAIAQGTYGLLFNE